MARMMVALAVITLMTVHIPKVISWSCFIHIGPHKTGSTEIQSFLMANKPAFKNLNYTVLGNIPKEPSAAFQYRFAHHVQQRSKESKPKENIYANVWNGMEDQMKACNSNIIVSSEWLPLLNSTSIQVLSDLLKCYETTIIAFHRSRLPLLRSSWSEDAKYSEHIPHEFLQLLDRDTSNEHGIGRVDETLISVLTAYAKEFGADNIHVLSFEGAVAKGNVKGFEAPISSFVEALGLHLEDAPFVTGRLSLNTSPKAEEIDTYIAVLEWKTFAHLSPTPSNEENHIRPVDPIHLMEAMREPCNNLPMNTTLLRPPAAYTAHDLMVGSKFGYFVVAPPTNFVFTEPMLLKTLCRQCLVEPESAAIWQKCVSAFDARMEQRLI